MKKILLTLLCLSVIGCSSLRSRKDRRCAADRRRHHEREPGDLPHRAGAGLEGRRLRAHGPGRRRSSNAWNNAGTGHSAFCELNYTSEGKDGSIDISKAVNVNEQFEVSKQFWAYQVEQGVLSNPRRSSTMCRT
jgi:malate dehydrogenase (quinone)